MDTASQQKTTAEQDGVIKPKGKPPDYDFLTLSVGTVVEVAGVKCKLQHVNQGKRRLTFVPVSPVQTMPVSATANPITQVTRKAKK